MTRDELAAQVRRHETIIGWLKSQVRVMRTAVEMGRERLAEVDRDNTWKPLGEPAADVVWKLADRKGPKS